MEYSSEQVYREFSRPLRHFILSRVSSAEDADDVLQEVFLKIQTHLDRVADPSRIHGWVYTIAKNTIIDHYRKKSNQPETGALEDIPDQDDDEDLAAHREMALCLKGMVERLPEIYRDAIILTEFNNLTQSELSERLGISRSGAKSRVQRGRKMLKEMLLACCRVETDRRGTIIDYEEKRVFEK